MPPELLITLQIQKDSALLFQNMFFILATVPHAGTMYHPHLIQPLRSSLSSDYNVYLLSHL